jgi:hypothetical protein
MTMESSGTQEQRKSFSSGDSLFDRLYNAAYDYAEAKDVWFALHLRYPGNDRIVLMKGEMTKADLPRKRPRRPLRQWPSFGRTRQAEVES